MQSIAVGASFPVNKEGCDFPDKENDFASASSPRSTKDVIQEHVVLSSEEEEEEKVPNSVVKDDESCNASKQLVCYESKDNVSNEPSACDPVSDNHSNSVSKELTLFDQKENITQLAPAPLDPPVGRGINMISRGIPSVGAYTVQCANCFKWRLIPTKKKYEEIREFILDEPFVCDAAREWKPDISCDEPPDIQQDGSRLWAIDKPSIAQTPPGWERELRIRGEGGSKFADVYYIAPNGKKLRSMNEVHKFLLEHPERIQEGVRASQFSFQIPKPLQENYVRKRPRLTSSSNDFTLTPRPREPDEASPIPLAAASVSPVLRLNSAADVDSPETQVKQQKKTLSPNSPSNERLHSRFKIKIAHSRPPTNTSDVV